MRKLTLSLSAAMLCSCAAQQQRELNAAFVESKRLSENARAQSIDSCSKSQQVAACMLGVAVAFSSNGAQNGPPVVQSDLSVLLNSSLLGSTVGAVRDVKVANTNARTQIAISHDNAQTAQTQSAAFAGVATAGLQAVQGASTDIASAGFGATNSIAQSALAGAADTSRSWATTVAGLPAAYQIGGDYVGGDYTRDQSQTGGDRIDGDGNSSRVTCTQQSYAGNGAAGGSGTGGSTGSTGAAGSGQAGSGAPGGAAGTGAIDCGGG